MTPGPAQLAAVGIVGGLLSLDRVAFMQSLISRPLPVAAIAGLLLGEPELGLFCGLYMELVWLSRQPVGGSVPPDETTAALAAVVAALATPNDWVLSGRAAAGVLVGLPYGFLGRRLELAARKRNSALVAETGEGLKRGLLGATGKAQALGAMNFLLAGTAGAMIAAFTAGFFGRAFFGAASDQVEAAMAVMSVVLPVVGAGSLLGSFYGRKPKLFFVTGALGAFAATRAGFHGAVAFLRGARG